MYASVTHTPWPNCPAILKLLSNAQYLFGQHSSNIILPSCLLVCTSMHVLGCKWCCLFKVWRSPHCQLSLFSFLPPCPLHSTCSWLYHITLHTLVLRVSDSFVMLPDAFSAYCGRQSSQFTPYPSSPTQHCSSHPDHTEWRSPQLNMLDVKERPSRSDLTTDITGAYDGSCMVDALSASSFPLKLSHQSLSQKSIRFIDP